MDVHYPSNNELPKLPKIGPWVVPLALIVCAFAAVGTLLYQVDQDEAGVVQRFGQYVRTTTPGLHFKWPFGVETVKKVKVMHVYKEEFGFRTIKAGVHSVYAGSEEMANQSPMRYDRQGRPIRGGDPFLEESMMLTGDLNVAVVEWIVQFTVKDPVLFAFRIRDQRETLRNMSEAVMRLVVGEHTVNEVLTSGRESIQNAVQEKLQQVLDSYQSGVQIQNVILQNVNPPAEVQPSFNEVNEARQEREKLINQAWAEYNRVIPRAKGEAEQVIREAEGYALDRINRSKGDAERFLLSWQAYTLAPEVTKRRLYLEMTQQVMPNLKEKLFLDSAQKGIVPLLNLTDEKGGQAS